MIADVKDGPSTSFRDEASLRDMLEVFRRGSALVDASLAAIAALRPKLDSLAGLIDRQAVDLAQIARDVSVLGPVLDMGMAEGENLLLTPRSGAANRPLVVFTLARQATGALSVQSIEIDRAAIAVSDGVRRQTDLPFDRLFQALNAVASPGEPDRLKRVRGAFAAFHAHTHLVVSRLSIAKARFDLQASFLHAIAQANASAATVRLETSFSGTGARDIAMETRKMLSGQSLNIANNRPDGMGDLLKTQSR